MVKLETALRDVVGIGNAIVDVLSYGDEALLETLQLVKGSMTLVDEHRSELIYSTMSDTVEKSGGSVANSVAGLAFLGASVSYIGRLGNDRLGRVFWDGLRSLGVSVDATCFADREGTGRCFVIVTSDGQRSMATHLGVCPDLKPSDIDIDTIQKHQVTYLEGYLWDLPDAKNALVRAAQYAHAADRKVALSLSDPFCVQRHRASFVELIGEYVDILFGNEEEIIALHEAVDFNDAVNHTRQFPGIAALTRGRHGSIIIRGDETYVINPAIVDNVVDTTGAGDLYASGVLFGVTKGYDLQASGDIGSIMAAEIISHLGARPSERSLEKLKSLDLG